MTSEHLSAPPGLSQLPFAPAARPCWCCPAPPSAPALAGIPGWAPGLSWPGIPRSRTLLAAAAAACLCFYADEPCASHSKALHRKSRFLCLVRGGRLRSGLSRALGAGLGRAAPPSRAQPSLPPPATSAQHSTRARTAGVIHSVPRLL